MNAFVLLSNSHCCSMPTVRTDRYPSVPQAGIGKLGVPSTPSSHSHSSSGSDTFGVSDSKDSVKQGELSDDTFNVLSEEKKTMLCIPVDLIEPTSGSKRYLEQGASASFTFRFQLCRGYRDRGGCNHRGECSFIHSRHVLDAALAARVKETPVHANCPVAYPGSLTPFPLLLPGVAVEVFDQSQQQNFVVDSGSLYETRGAIAALEKCAAATRALEDDGPLPSLACGTLLPPPTVPSELQVCCHFDRGICARGRECLFAHRISYFAIPKGSLVIPMQQKFVTSRHTTVANNNHSDSLRHVAQELLQRQTFTSATKSH